MPNVYRLHVPEVFALLAADMATVQGQPTPIYECTAKRAKYIIWRCPYILAFQPNDFKD